MIGQKIIGIICIIIGIYFLSKVSWKMKEDKKNRSHISDILNSGKEKNLDKYFTAGYTLTNSGILSEGFGVLFIIYGIDLLFLR